MVIDSKTGVSLFTVIGTLPFIVGAILWLTDTNALAKSAYAKGVSNEKALYKVQKSLLRLEIKQGTLPKDALDLPGDQGDQ